MTKTTLTDDKLRGEVLGRVCHIRLTSSDNLSSLGAAVMGAGENFGNTSPHGRVLARLVSQEFETSTTGITRTLTDKLSLPGRSRTVREQGERQMQRRSVYEELPTRRYISMEACG